MPRIPSEVHDAYRANSRGDPVRGDEPLRHLQGDRHRSSAALSVPARKVELDSHQRGQGLGRPRVGDRDPAPAREEGWLTMASLRKRGSIWYYRFVNA